MFPPEIRKHIARFRKYEQTAQLHQTNEKLLAIVGEANQTINKISEELAKEMEARKKAEKKATVLTWISIALGILSLVLTWILAKR